MKKDSKINAEVGKIAGEIENAGLDVPKIKCSICGRETPGPCGICIAGGMASCTADGTVHAG